jgi:serine/threonine protein phosphatase 1
MANFVIGDIHGRYNALIDVIDQAGLDYQNDVLISLGDIVDGGEHTNQCISELIKIKNCVACKGNHDAWALGWMLTGGELPVWVHQGGYATMRSYDYDFKSVPKRHICFLDNAVPFWIDTKQRIYVHGGFDPNIPMWKQEEHDLMWNRKLIDYARNEKIVDFNHVFVGHTSTQFIKCDTNCVEPLTFNNLTAMDTGAGWLGKLTLMDVDSREYWQSELQHPNI